jgi:hypothetical protein
MLVETDIQETMYYVPGVGKVGVRLVHKPSGFSVEAGNHGKKKLNRLQARVDLISKIKSVRERDNLL